MKTKLLKKSRKRFTIEHLPAGYIGCRGDIYDYNLFRVLDIKRRFYDFDNYVQVGINIKGSQFCNRIVDTEVEAFNICKQIIIDTLNKEFFMFKRKNQVIHSKIKKVWYQ